MSVDQHTTSAPFLCLLFARASAGTGDNEGGHTDEVARLVETLALGSSVKSTQKIHQAKWKTWVQEIPAKEKDPGLHTLADPKDVLPDLLPGSWRFDVSCTIIGSLPS